MIEEREGESEREDTPTEGERLAAAPPAGPPKLAFVAAACALVALGAAFVWSVRRPVTISGLRIGGQPIGGVPFADLEARLAGAIDKYLDGTVVLRVGSDRLRAPRREVGFTVDRALTVAAVRDAGKSGWPLADLVTRSRARRGRVDLLLPVDVDRARSLEFLTNLKDDVDRAALDAHLDLERHTVSPGKPGTLLRVYDSMVALEYGARSGAPEIEMSIVAMAPRVDAADLKDVDISTVLGNWETRYSASQVDSDRTYNLKVGADKLNGHILKPHEVFSFNQVVGDRTEKEGYRVAPVIQSGELIDGLAGGMCQIASTLHAAAFFAGLEIVHSSPHSRPSAYITMGLDSTVVYPSTDLKLRNPYEFPVVMHYQVNQGSVKVELLGKEKPYKVLFEREIKIETPHGATTRHDPEAPEGQRLMLQDGYPGYQLIRRRYIFDKNALPKWYGPEPLSDMLKKQKKKPIKKEQWALRYPATIEIVAVGSGGATLKKKPPPPSHRIPPLNPKDKPIFKMIR